MCISVFDFGPGYIISKRHKRTFLKVSMRAYDSSATSRLVHTLSSAVNALIDSPFSPLSVE